VEVCLNEAWGTVCDQNWSVEDARVVCGQLGFLRTGALSYSDALLGQGTGLILMSNVRCTGSESTIRGCSHYSTTGSCTHADDAGVKCRTCKFSELEVS
jgi:deleted-in-malignant-brain-tumors protein 1